MKRLANHVVIFLLLISAGCVSDQSFRTHIHATDPKDPQADIEDHHTYKLGVVEFDDQGEFWNIDQCKAVERMVSSEMGLKEGDSPQPVLLVTFVHGWKDDADYNNDGMQSFRQILCNLAQNEQAPSGTHRKVVGVYCGWRGLSASWEPFKEMSFYQRLDAAHKVGGYGAMARLFVDLENIQQENLRRLADSHQPRTELVIIGHSMGAGAVFSALESIVIERLDKATTQKAVVKPLGDQVILLNPAFEAVRYFDLHQMARQITDWPAEQRPVLSIFTSKGDWATRYAFPFGRVFSTLFESTHDDQKASTLEAVGWYEPFRTHNLCYNGKGDCPATQPTTQLSALNAAAQRHDIRSAITMQDSASNIEKQRKRWKAPKEKPEPYPFDETVLVPNDHYRPRDPFLVVSVDPQIMGGHTDISNPVLINFIREYVEFCRNDRADRSN